MKCILNDPSDFRLIIVMFGGFLLACWALNLVMG